MSLSLWITSMYGWVRDKYSTLPETVVDLTGRTVLITGANTGVGLEAAKSFYRMHPARLILAVRDVDKGQAAKEILAKEEKTGKTKVDVWKLDMADFESVKAFGARCESELDRLDIAIENAGVFMGPWASTKDGWEIRLQVNVLSTFLLATLLAPLLARTAALPAIPGSQLTKPRLVIVSSEMYMFSQFPEKSQPNILEAMNKEAQYPQSDRYSTTKFLDLILAQHLAKVPIFKDVVVCSVNPGYCRTDLWRNMPTLLRTVFYVGMARPASEGAKTYTWVALAAEVSSGSYSSNCAVVIPTSVAAASDIPDLTNRLCKEMGDVLGKIYPDTNGIWK